jgi:hypothetical protein
MPVLKDSVQAEGALVDVLVGWSFAGTQVGFRPLVNYRKMPWALPKTRTGSGWQKPLP